MTWLQMTGVYVAVAGLLAMVAYATAPNMIDPAIAPDRGQPFFPQFTDPNAATSLEVIEFEEQTSVARPFKVLNRDGRWTIPSHYDYPADASDRLPSIAAAVIALKKGDVVSDNVVDQERCGVLDPLDDTLPALKGRGTRVTVKGGGEEVLADIIFGAPVEGRPALRYVRLPGERRIYVADVGQLDISTTFQDWIDRDLLGVERTDIDRVMIRNYAATSVEDVTLREILALRATGRDQWALEGMAPSERIETFPMNLLVTTLDDLALADVRPKPAALAAMLAGTGPNQELAGPEVEDLTNKGFFITTHGILGSDGDVVVHTTSGIFFTLRFGRIAPDMVAAPAGDAAPAKTFRYLFISATLELPAAGSEVDPAVRNRLEVLRARFAPWYYVIADDAFQKIRLPRQRLVKSLGRHSTASETPPGP